MKNIIKSVSYDQEEIIQNIIDLYIPKGEIDCDPTYSKGNFYKSGIKEPLYKFDVNPIEGVTYADCRHLPLGDSSLGSLIFDPPFLATTGKSLSSTDNNNIINKRFTVFPNEKTLHYFYIESLREFYRVLKEKGILIFKCQDKISSGKQYLSHVFIINEAIKIGFYPKDLFILLAKNRIIANWQRNQKHARKYHSYFLVFEKCSKFIDYI